MSDEEPRDDESVELGPDDVLQESAQEWIEGAAVIVGAGTVAVSLARLRLDRDRLEFDREKFAAEQQSEPQVSSDEQA